jgi:hypothetical protein
MSMTFSASEKRITDQYPNGIFAWVDGPEVNCSNTNACAVLGLLGYHSIAEDCCGVIDPNELVTHCLTALFGIVEQPAIDASTPATQGVGDGGATWIDCGRRDGYFNERLTAILGVAEFTAKLGPNHFVSVG